jgi:IS5 family transposase
VPELVNLFDQRHELVRVCQLIDWQAFESQWDAQVASATGGRAFRTRLMVARLHLNDGRHPGS